MNHDAFYFNSFQFISSIGRVVEQRNVLDNHVAALRALHRTRFFGYRIKPHASLFLFRIKRYIDKTSTKYITFRTLYNYNINIDEHIKDLHYVGESMRCNEDFKKNAPRDSSD